MSPEDVMDRIKMARDLTAIVDQLAETGAEGLIGHLSPHLRAGEILPDVALARRLMGRLAMARLRLLADADDLSSRALRNLDGASEPLLHDHDDQE